jgi:tRNA threonylcarbamoyl adenosine modification protein YeaZ
LRPDAPLLVFDTSAAHCAAALLSGGRVLAERCEDMGRGQAERLMPLLEDLLDEARLAWGDLGALAVGTGPGNFTGIRIAVATARGLSMALGIPAIGVTGFAALAAQEVGEGTELLVSLPAPRGNSYVEVWRNGAPAAPARLIDPEHPPDDLAFRAENLRVIGHRADDMARAIGATAGRTAPASPALAIASVAAARLAKADLPATPPAPVYVRPADAAPARDAPPTILP